MRILVTGGCGFIGSALVLHLVRDLGHQVVNLDALAYSACPASLDDLARDPAYAFEHADIRDGAAVARILARHAPDAVVHLAAESHVDRSIDGAGPFVETNIVGTFTLIEALRRHLATLPEARRAAFRLVHVSTDEVWGSLGAEGAFRETTPRDPTSPYAASKAAADHLVLAWHRTYGLPAIVANCSNNYGPRQFPEKLIPLILLNAIEGRPLPVYGDGAQVRDWLYVEDHVRALALLLARGRPGETYAIGGRAERTNLAVVETICRLLDDRRGTGAPHRRHVRHVADRPGHDRRYAIDPAKIEREVGWRAERSFEDGMARTVDWYLANEPWWRPLRDGVYAGQRLGLAV